MAYTDPPTFVDAAALAASSLNTYLRDNMRAMNRWNTYTPAFTSGGTAPVIGNGVVSGRYVQFEQWCLCQVILVGGSTTNMGTGLISHSLPVQASAVIAGGEQTFPGMLLDVGVQRYATLGVIPSNATAAQIVGSSVFTSNTGGLWTGTTPFTFGSTDIYSATFAYRTV